MKHIICLSNLLIEARVVSTFGYLNNDAVNTGLHVSV